MNFLTPAAWCAALFIAATLFSHTVALRLLLLLCGISLLIVEALRRRLQAEGQVDFRPPLLVPFALWAAWALLSLAWSLDPELTTKELRNEIGYAAGAFWLCFVAGQAPRAPGIVAGVAAVGAIAVCAAALGESSIVRLAALQLHGGPGAFSSTLLILYPCSIAAAWFAWTRRFHPALIAFPLALVPLYIAAGHASQNRILWVGLAIETALLGLLLAFRPASMAIGKRGIVVAAALLIAGSGVMFDRVNSERLASVQSASDARPGLWQVVLRRIEERPLAGLGFGRGMLRHELREELDNRFLWHSHNLFLDTALQLGWTGLALLLLLFGWTAGLAWRLARSTSDVAFACGLALLPLVAGTMARNMTDVLWVRQSALLYWGVVGVLLAWGLRAARAPAAR